MAALQIENLPDELYCQIQSLAETNNCTFDEAVIYLLDQAIHLHPKRMPPERAVTEILQDIRARPRVNPDDFGLSDSTILIQEDRDR